MRLRWSLLLAAGCAAGASSVLPTARFANAPVVEAVNDRRDVPKPPSHRDYVADLYLFDGTFVRPVTRALELPQSGRALGVNALDEVPDSTWFTNRIGTHELTPAEVGRGPVTHDPEGARPWQLLKRKTSGTSIGIMIKDAQGVQYMLKLEGKDDPPELETATDAIVDRLMWACGYNVPEDLVVYFSPEDLVLPRGKSIQDRDGHRITHLDPATVAQLLDGARRDKDGRYRALASRWIDGKTLGGHPGEGVRKDDPNDRIPHQRRRELRGMYTIDAWLDAVDVTEGQFVDTWEADPANPKRHYVKHYVIDFGKSLGAMGGIGHDWWRGFAYRIDLGEMLREIVTFGLDARPWQRRVGPRIVGVSPLFEAMTFDPGAWHPDTPGYMPFQLADRFDKFWAATILAHFTPDQLREAVRAGRFTDPHAVDYLTATLVARQRETMAYWFARVNPIDHVAMEGEKLCFDDLGVTYGLDTGERTTYSFASYDFDGHPITTPSWFAYPQSGGRTCTPVYFAPKSDRDGYTIVEISTERPGFTGTTYIYLARAPDGAARVVGLWRG